MKLSRKLTVTDCKTLGIKFLVGVHRPETVLQVVVLNGTELLDGRITAVVIGEEKSLIRDYLTGTAVAENDYGVLQCSIVQIIYLLWGDLESKFGHPAAVHFFQQRQNPHSLIRLDRDKRQKQQH